MSTILALPDEPECASMTQGRRGVRQRSSEDKQPQGGATAYARQFLSATLISNADPDLSVRPESFVS